MAANAMANPASSTSEVEPSQPSGAMVTARVPSEQATLGRALSNTVVFRMLQLLVVGNAVVFVTTLAESRRAAAGMARPNDLLYLNAALESLGHAMLLLPLGSARDALRPGGALEQLGAREQTINVRIWKELTRWRVGLALLAASYAVQGVFMFAVGAFVGRSPSSAGWLPMAVGQRVWITVYGLLLCFIYPVVFCGWWASMRVASCLSRDSIHGVIQKVETTDPTDDSSNSGDAWEAQVVAPALALEKTMKTLSDGWASGLLGAGGFMGLTALGEFMLAINADFCDGVDTKGGETPGATRDSRLLTAAFYPGLALLLALDLGTTSSRCDLLMSKLNQAGIKHGSKFHSTIDWLECRLMRLNDGQGLGFRFGHTIINRATLTQTAIRLAGAVTTVYSIVLAMIESPTGLAAEGGAVTSVCELSELQTKIIRTMLSERNATCSYNMTVDDLLLGE